MVEISLSGSGEGPRSSWPGATLPDRRGSSSRRHRRLEARHAALVSDLVRAGCMAHARRKVFDALSGHDEAQIALDLIRALYVVEHEAKEKGLACTDELLPAR